MKNIIISIFLSLFMTTILLPQQTIAQTTSEYKFWVSLTDKNNSPYSVSQPLDFLSQRAIDRRNAQNIIITTQDLPVNPAYIADVRNTGVNIIGTSRWMNGILVLTTDSSKADDLAALTCVDEVVWVGKYTYLEKSFSKGGGDAIELEQIEDEMDYIKNSNLQNGIDYGFGYNQASMLAVDYLHDLGHKGDGKIIAILDAGFYRVDVLSAFDSLFFQSRILGTHDVSPVSYTHLTLPTKRIV